MKKINKKKDYTKPIVITVIALLIIAGGITAFLILTNDTVTDRNISKYVTLGQYKGIEYEPISTEVTDKDIEDRINVKLNNVANTVDVTDRAVQDGDTVIIDFAGYLDGVQFDGGTSEDYSLTIGSGNFIPGFEEQVIGHNIGEEFDINVTFPDDYSKEELAGQPVVFKINLKSISAKVIPEFNDEFVKENSEVTTIAEYRELIREELQAEKNQEAEDGMKNSVWNTVVKNATILKFPKKDIETQTESIMAEYESFATAYNMDIQSLASEFYGTSLEEFIATEVDPAAENNVKSDLVLRAIAVAENITITDADIQAGSEKFAEEYGYESAEAFLESYDRETVRLALLSEKVIEAVINNAVAK